MHFMVAVKKASVWQLKAKPGIPRVRDCAVHQIFYGAKRKKISKNDSNNNINSSDCPKRIVDKIS